MRPEQANNDLFPLKRDDDDDDHKVKTQFSNFWGIINFSPKLKESGTGENFAC
jgi:hypothetical protein